MSHNLHTHNPDEPHLEWCAGCDFPKDLCQCAAIAADVALPEVPQPATPTKPADSAEPSNVATDQVKPVERVVVPMSGAMRFAAGLIVLGALALGIIGLAASFQTVTEAMRPAFGDFAPFVPLAIDIGIFVFAGLNIFLACLGMPISWLRLIPWALTAAMIYLNVTAYTVIEYQVAHAVLPSMWVVTCEVAAHVIRIRTGIARGTHTEGIPFARWLLAPISSAKLYRVMRLWDIKSYREVLASERRRLAAKSALIEHYGWNWPIKAPVMARHAYRMRELTAQDVADMATPQPAPTENQATEPASALPQERKTTTADKPVNRSPKQPKKTKATRSKTRTDADLKALLAEINRDEDGTVPVRRAARELKCGPDRARRLLTDAGLLKTTSDK